ncbi:hypothetical protein [Pseudomonas alkylphenolica]|uniref:hypothetical protein n=1 Tax=Pseudomonas alkylphenolica TaxID=237609 RepID=UPI00315DA27C
MPQIVPFIIDIKDKTGRPIENGETVETPSDPIEVRGTASPESKVKIFDGNNELGEAIANEHAIWTFKFSTFGAIKKFSIKTKVESEVYEFTSQERVGP